MARSRSGRGARVAPSTTLAVASFGAFLAFLDATVVNVAFPSIRESFSGASIGDLSWVLNAYNIAFASFLIVFGRLADLVGRKRLFFAGTLVFTLASVWCAASGSIEMLIVARTVQALGAAMLVPASLAIVVDAFPPERRSHAVGLWGASAAVAAGLGPPIGGALVQWGDWRWAFLINLPFGLVALMLVRRSLVESRAPGRRRMPDLRGALLMAGAISLITLGIVQGNDWGWSSARVLGSFVGAVVLAGAFVASSRAHPQPLLDPALLRIRPFSVGNLVTLVAGMGFYAYLLTNILWLQYVWQYSVLEAGLALLPGAVVAAVTAARLGEFAQEHGYRKVIVPGALVWCAAYLWYALIVGPEPAFLTQWLPGQVLSGVGVGATLPLLGSAALAAVPGGRFATASAVLSSTRQLGGVLGIAILVVIIGTPTPATVLDVLPHGWIFCAGCFAVVAMGALALGDLSKVAVAEEDESHGPAPYVPERGRLTGPTPPPESTIPARMLASLEVTGELVTVRAGEWLFETGDLADAMYVVHTGRLDVVMDAVVVRELGPGSLVGELALLAGEGRRSASIRARRDATLVRVTRHDFQVVMADDREAPMALASALAVQLQTPTIHREASAGAPAVIAVLGLHDGAPVPSVADALKRGLARQLSVVSLADVAGDQLARAELDHDRVLLVADSPEAPAFAAGLRQADRIVLVSSVWAPVPEAWDGPRGADLVLVGKRATAAELDLWCAAVGPSQVWQVDPDDDLRDLADRLGGNSLGVVLAGGGARAMTSIGVLLELEESGLRIDRIAGTSLGAIVGGMYATGVNAEELHERAYAGFVRHNPFGDYTLPTAALVKGQRTIDLLRRNLGEARIETLPRLFRCVSTDLFARTPYVHTSGLLWQACAASARLPVLFPPMQVDGRVLVDGSILDNLPAWLLTERAEGPVVAVNMSMGGNGKVNGKAAGGVDGPAVPLQRRSPALGETLLRTMTIGASSAADNARAGGAYVITPPSLGVGMLEFHQMDRMVEAGRIAARELLEATGGILVAAR